MENVISFRKYGSNLSTRDLGKELREQILHSWDNYTKIIFDFENVDMITNSFADECFAKILDEKKFNEMVSVTTFININDIVNSSIILAIKRRLNN